LRGLLTAIDGSKEATGVSDDDERLRQAIRAGNIGIFEHDHLRDVIHWSTELRQIYGWDGDEPATLPKIVSHVHPDDFDRVVAAVRSAHDPTGDGAFDIEHRIYDRGGELRWVLLRSQTHFGSVAGELRPVRTIGAVQDVTARHVAEERLRLLEAQLLQSQKMESIGRLAGGIAHDFNNLLTVICGGLELGLGKLPPEHASRTHLADVAEAARSAVVLTRQLLAFSRKELIAPKVLDLNEVIDRMRNMILRLLGEDIRLEIRCAEDLTPIRFDPGQVEQILMNLAVNARDAMPTGGRLTIQTSNVRVDETSADGYVDARPGSYALLAVVDDGAGMSEEVRAHLFEPFFTTKVAGKGTGLGLAMVYGSVQQNGGFIEVDSEVNRGTTFRIHLPAAARASPLPQARGSTSVATGNASILLVEDDEKVRLLAKNVLEDFGYTVHPFESGEEALAALPALDPSPELLITDVIMPGMNGRRLAERVTALLPCVRVLFVSGYAQDVIADHGTLPGGIEFLAKPYSISELARRVHEVLQKGA
jgi:PAS domain S-box-containing protein